MAGVSLDRTSSDSSIRAPHLISPLAAAYLPTKPGRNGRYSVRKSSFGRYAWYGSYLPGGGRAVAWEGASRPSRREEANAHGDCRVAEVTRPASFPGGRRPSGRR